MFNAVFGNKRDKGRKAEGKKNQRHEGKNCCLCIMLVITVILFFNYNYVVQKQVFFMMLLCITFFFYFASNAGLLFSWVIYQELF